MQFYENDMRDTAKKIRHALRCLVFCIEQLNVAEESDFRDTLINGTNSFADAKEVLDKTHFIYNKENN